MAEGEKANLVYNVDGGRYNLLREMSEDVAHTFEDESFDLVFVDGPHTYKHVSRDINNYGIKVKKGGLLVAIKSVFFTISLLNVLMIILLGAASLKFLTTFKSLKSTV